MAADSVTIPGLTESPAEQGRHTEPYPLSNGITVGSQESEGYGSGSQTTDGQLSTTALEVMSRVCCLVPCKRDVTCATLGFVRRDTRGSVDRAGNESWCTESRRSNGTNGCC